VKNDLATLRHIVNARLWWLTSVVRHAAPPDGSGVDYVHVRRSVVAFPRRTSMRSAVEALTPVLARELAPVRVNVVTQSLIDTPLLHTAYGAEHDAIVQNRAAVLPGRRAGTAEEVAQVIVLLMTNAYLTGEVVHVDEGGRFV
jgi:NAD(P)-dependent dehydrogenase (short-subunit alcohol dehydrogenase family)